MRLPPRARPAAERVLARIDTSDRSVCWPWPGALFSNGYGHIGGAGRGGGDLLVHVVVFEHFHGPVPEGMELDHDCRVKRCCNPFEGHVQPATRGENQSRAMRLDQARCRSGRHAWIPENLRIVNGRPTCRRCENERQRERRARR
jgi:hypothetical protein